MIPISGSGRFKVKPKDIAVVSPYRLIFFLNTVGSQFNNMFGRHEKHCSIEIYCYIETHL